MAEYTSENLEAKPYFDIELLLKLSQETRVDGELMDKMSALWEKWLNHLTVKKIKVGKIQYLAVWLDEEVEKDTDGAWDESPSDAFMITNLAQAFVMGSIYSLLPDVETAGCAPAPRPTDGLVEAMEDLGCPYNDNASALSRRYAVLTFYPFKGACDICYLQPDCPKGNGEDKGSGSFTLPGFESDPQ